jgi:hypothetical protein
VPGYPLTVLDLSWKMAAEKDTNERSRALVAYTARRTRRTKLSVTAKNSILLRAAARYRGLLMMEALFIHLPRKLEDQPHTYSTDRLTLCLACVSDAFHEPKRVPLTTNISTLHQL